MKRECLDELFARADANLCCNTSYPLSPDCFADYRKGIDIMSGVREMSFYLHIPFCRRLCRYCEYTRFAAGDSRTELKYLSLLKRQCDAFIDAHPGVFLRGFDVGGGTPTAIHDAAFAQLMDLCAGLRKNLPYDPAMSSSLEFSTETLDEAKLAMIPKGGFSRVSTGVQVVGTAFAQAYNRTESSVERTAAAFDFLSRRGVKETNIDVMYGLPEQQDESLSKTIEWVSLVRPSQVTLYEMRYNMTSLTPTSVSRERNYRQYSYLFDRLLDLGYRGDFGQNALSLNGGPAVSSYLQARMEEGLPYKGFGVSAQSMSDRGLSYNSLKGCAAQDLPALERIEAEDVYELPGEELAAKYISIALYSGRFRRETVTRLLGLDCDAHYAEELDYLIGRALIEEHGGYYRLTRLGVRYYGAVAAQFWSAQHKARFLAS